METTFVESVVRTNKLHCSLCKAKIHIGDDVIFELDEDNKMVNVFGDTCNCKADYENSVYDEHAFSSEALGQWS